MEIENCMSLFWESIWNGRAETGCCYKSMYGRKLAIVNQARKWFWENIRGFDDGYVRGHNRKSEGWNGKIFRKIHPSWTNTISSRTLPKREPPAVCRKVHSFGALSVIKSAINFLGKLTDSPTNLVAHKKLVAIEMRANERYKTWL